MISYALKRITRSLGLFIALFLGVTLASIFFTGINIGADSTVKAALNQQLETVLVDITASGWDSILSFANWTTARDRAFMVQGVIDSEVISRGDTYHDAENYTFYKVVGVSGSSRIYSGLNITSGARHLEENETYIWTGSQDNQQLKINNTLILNFTVPIFDYNYTEKTISIPLKVVGFVDLDDTAYALASGQYQRDIFESSSRGIEEVIPYPGNLLIVDWEKTFSNLLDSIYSLNRARALFNTDLIVFIDRESVINPWDIGASQEAINRIVGQISNVLAEFELTAYSNLYNVLNMFNFLSLTLRVSFLVVALPVFFVAWYVGTTVSDVSFNLRRREIGLLLAKGFSSGQLFRLFLSESLLIGVLGGLTGVGIGFLFSPYFVPVISSEAANSTPVLTFEMIVLTIVFSTSITLLSTFRPSRKAAKLPAVDAMKEYILLEEIKPYKKRWPLAALILGSYKIGMFLIGVPSVAQIFAGRPLPFSNILLTILMITWTAIDGALTPLGPVLFFWGITKILIRGSLRFQEAAARTARFLGDLGVLATKNVQRNPARAASVAFLIALIIGYGFQTVLSLASEEDYIIRQVKTNVGADISVSLDDLTNSTEVIENIKELPGIESVTTLYSFYGTTSLHSILLVAVESEEWLSTAYYENEWFTGNNVQSASQQMADRNNTIILEIGVANDLDLGIGESVTINFNGAIAILEVIGFFGHEVGGGVQPLIRDSQTQFMGSRFWSYVPVSLYQSLGGSLFASEELFIKVETSADEKNIVEQIRNFNTTTTLHVESVEEQLEERESNLLLSSTTIIQRIGVLFAVLAGSIATALVRMVSLQERKKEVAVMNVRGISLRQLITILLSESLSIILFAIMLGVIVGVIIAHGSIASLNSTLYTLVTHRIVLPIDSILMLSMSIILVFTFSIIPIFVMSKRYTSKLERIVRV